MNTDSISNLLKNLLVAASILAVMATFVIGFFWGLDILWDYRQQQTPLKYVEQKIAEKCSVPQRCTAIMHDRTTKNLQMVGDVNETWIILG